MSYILDALRKSDLQRQRGATPTLLAVQDSAVARKQPAFFAYALLAAVLVGAGMVIGWLRPWQSEQAAPVRPESMAAKPREPAPAPSETAPQPKSEPMLQNATQPAQATPAPSETAVQAKPKRKPGRELLARAMPHTDGPRRELDAAASSREATPARERSADTATADDAGEPSVISMAELPPSVRQELPAMKISVHAYSGNPGARLVSINNRILREGDSVVPGLELEEITPDGMIFGYKGYRFHRGVK